MLLYNLSLRHCYPALLLSSSSSTPFHTCFNPLTLPPLLLFFYLPSFAVAVLLFLLVLSLYHSLPLSLSMSSLTAMDGLLTVGAAFIGAVRLALPEANGIQMWPSAVVTATIYGERERFVFFMCCRTFSTHVQMFSAVYLCDSNSQKRPQKVADSNPEVATSPRQTNNQDSELTTERERVQVLPGCLKCGIYNVLV